MRFLFVGPGLCLQLPSDSGSPRTPLLFGYRFPPSGSEEDLHLQVTNQAPHLIGWRLRATRYAWRTYKKARKLLRASLDSVLRRDTFSNPSVGILQVSVAYSLHEHINRVLALFLLFQGVYISPWRMKCVDSLFSVVSRNTFQFFSKNGNCSTCIIIISPFLSLVKKFSLPW